VGRFSSSPRAHAPTRSRVNPGAPAAGRPSGATTGLGRAFRASATRTAKSIFSLVPDPRPHPLRSNCPRRRRHDRTGRFSSGGVNGGGSFVSRAGFHGRCRRWRRGSESPDLARERYASPCRRATPSSPALGRFLPASGFRLKHLPSSSPSVDEPPSSSPGHVRLQVERKRRARRPNARARPAAKSPATVAARSPVATRRGSTEAYGT